jgi:amino-acid N-acetyltransferase
MEYIVRQARTGDIPEIRELIDQNVGSGRLLDKHTVNLYEDVLEFTVAQASADGAVVGCGALHVMWEDLAELRTVVVDERKRGTGIGHLIVDELLDRARAVGVSRVFVLTFAVPFFASHGFIEISGTPVAPEVYAELLRSYDDGVAEFLDLDRVKPNTLGNTRMLCFLRGGDPPAPPGMGGLRPPISPPREDAAKGAAPPALWLGLGPCGCGRQALRSPQRLVLWLGLRPCGCGKQAPQKASAASPARAVAGLEQTSAAPGCFLPEDGSAAGPGLARRSVVSRWSPVSGLSGAGRVPIAGTSPVVSGRRGMPAPNAADRD